MDKNAATEKMKLTANTLSLLSWYLNPNKTKLKQPKEKSQLPHLATWKGNKHAQEIASNNKQENSKGIQAIPAFSKPKDQIFIKIAAKKDFNQQKNLNFSTKPLTTETRKEGKQDRTQDSQFISSSADLRKRRNRPDFIQGLQVNSFDEELGSIPWKGDRSQCNL